MKKAAGLLLIVTASFLCGFGTYSVLAEQHKKSSTMKKVTGIGGIFFKCKDPKKMKDRYA